jgi:hypothetical protein
LRTNPKTLHNPETSFSEPVDAFSSDAESFDEDDMYGSDHGMQTVGEVSDDEKEVEASEASFGRAVFDGHFLIPSEQLTLE